MFSDTVYYPHVLEIQVLFMRALFKNLIRARDRRTEKKRKEHTTPKHDKTLKSTKIIKKINDKNNNRKKSQCENAE